MQKVLSVMVQPLAKKFLKDQKVRIFTHTQGPLLDPHRPPQSNQRSLGNIRVFDFHAFQQEPMREKALSLKDLWVWLLFNGVKPSENPCKILRVLKKMGSAETLQAWIETGKVKKEAVKIPRFCWKKAG